MICCAGNEDQAREERGEGTGATGEEGAETGTEREETEETSHGTKQVERTAPWTVGSYDSLGEFDNKLQ